MSLRLRRLLVLIVAGAVLLPALLLVALHLPWVQRTLVTRVLDDLRTSAGLDITVRAVHLSPMRLSMTADGLRVAAVGHPDVPLLEAAHVDVDLARVVLTSRGRDLAIQRLVLDEPSVRLRRDASGAWNLPPTDPDAPATELPHLTIDDLQVRGGRVLVEDAAADLSVRLTDVHITPDDRGFFEAGASVDARVVEARMTGTLDGGLAFDGRLLTTRSVALRTERSVLMTDGTYDIESASLNLTSTLDLDATEFAAFAGTPGLQGQLEGRVTLTGTADAPHADWTLRGREITDGTLPGLAFDGDGTADSASLRVRALTADLAGGTVSLDGDIGLSSGVATALDARVRDLRVHDLLRAYAPDVPVVSLLNATMSARGDALDWQQWRSTVEAALRVPVTPSRPGDWPLDGVARASIDQRRWRVEANIASPDAGVVVARLDGTVAPVPAESTISGTIRADVDDLAAAVPRLTATPTDVTGRTAIDLRLSGTIAAPRAAWTLDATAATSTISPVIALATGTASPQQVEVTSLALTSGPNEVTADLVLGLSGDRRLGGSFRGALPAVDALLADGTPLGWPLTGAAAFTGTLGGTLARPVAQADLTLEGISFAGQTVDTAAAVIELRGTSLEARRIDARSGDGRLSGVLALDLSDRTHQARLSLTDWPVQPLPPVPGDPTSVETPLTAVLGAVIDTGGPIDQPSGTISADLSRITWQGHAVSPLRLRADAHGQYADVTFETPELRTTGTGRVQLSGRYAFDLTTTTDGLTLDPFRPWLPEVLARASAAVSADIRVQGEATDLPASASATVQLHRFSLAIDEARLDLDAPANVTANSRDVSVDVLALRTGDLAVRIDGTLGRTDDGVPLALTVNGSLPSLAPWLSAFDVEAPELTGTVALQVAVGGTMDAPRPSGRLLLSDAVITSRPQVSMRLPQLTAVLDAGVLTLEPTTAEWEDARISASGRLPLRLLGSLVGGEWQAWLGDAPGLATLSAQTTALHTRLLEPFLGRDALEGITGQVTARLDAEASSATWAGLSGVLTLDEAEFTLAGLPLAQARPTVLRLENGALQARDVLFSGVNTDLAIDGVADLSPASPTFDVQVRGLTDLAILRPFLVGAGVASGGRTEVNLRASGSVDAPDLTGELIVTDGSLRLADPRLVLELLNGTATFTGRQMAMPALSGLANGAPVTLSAALALSPENALGGQVRIRAEGVPLEAPEGLRTESDVDVLASIAGSRVDVSGSIDVLRGTYRDPIALSALSTGLLSSSPVDVTGAEASSMDVRFDVQVRTREDLLVDNNYGRFAAGGAVRVIGTLDEPALSGRITIAEGGELYLGGLTYRVERGAVDFANPSRIEPSVDLAAETRARGERIRIEASGTPETLEVTLSAPDADVAPSQAELASLLVSGRTLDDLSGAAAGEQALGLLSADLLGVVGRGVGLDALRLDRDLLIDDRTRTGDADIAAETDPVARLTLAKRLPSNVEVVFSQNLRDASEITWLITWAPFRHTELRLLQRDDRSMSYEFRHEVVFGAPPAPPRVRETPTRVRSVNVVASDPVVTQGLERRLKLAPGDRFDFYRWQDDRDRMDAWMRSERYYEHRVIARRTTIEGAEGPLVDLRYDVTPGPRARLEVVGATLDAGVLERMREAWYGSVFDGFLQDDLARLAREAMLDRGFPLAAADASTSTTPGGDEKTALVVIEPGPPLGRRLEVTGIAGTLARRFDDWLAAGPERHAWLDPSAFERNARDWLRSRGALMAEVAVSEPDRRDADAVRTVRVEKATPYLLARVETTGVPDVRRQAVQDELGLTSGDEYDALVLSLARRTLERWYAAEGFRDVEVDVTTVVRHDEEAIDLVVDVKEGARAVIVESRVEGGRLTQRALLDRALALPQGIIATPQQLLSARKRLYDTGVLASVDVEAAPVGGVSETADGTLEQPVVVTGTVRELPRLRLRYGLAVNDDVLQDEALRATSSRRVTPGLSAMLENRNLFGRAVVGGLSARYERARQSGRAFLTSPALLGRDVRLQASSGLTRSRLVPDRAESPLDVRTDATLGATQRLPGLEGLTLTYGYRFERSHTYDPNDPDFDITIAAPRLTSTAFVDRRDDANEATRGWLHASTVEVSRGWVGSDFEFIKYYGQQTLFHRLGRTVLAGRAQAGLGRGFSGQDLLGSERFSAGGAMSVRGYAESTIGELDPILGIARGDGLLVVNGEVRLPLWRWISGVGFLDGGGVYERVSDFGVGGLRWGTGAGVRVSTPAGLVRVDFGVPLAPRPSDKAWLVYVGLGQVF